jgi:hypothetical protein
MIGFQDVIEFYVNAVENFKEGVLDLCSPLEEIVLKSAGDNLAYVDNRRDALQKYGFDFWKGERPTGIDGKLLYSKSEMFPDFLFKVRRMNSGFTCGSLLELKDSESGNVASFNSTIPTRFKSLEEVDIVNGKSLVSRIASIKDGVVDYTKSNYYTFDRHCFYLVRTHRCNGRRVKLSVVDGSFFETVPKEHLFHQLFLQVLRNHIAKKQLKISEDVLRQVENTLAYITDQTIIASSRIIEGASIRPRLRIMAEVHSEGNPHSSHYPEIVENSFNLILKATPEVGELERELPQRIHGIRVFKIHHKRNGPHVVFQFCPTPQKTLDNQLDWKKV